MDEEKHQPDFPFWEGRTFHLRIFVAPDEYRVMVNGQDFVDYNHRMPFEQVKFLELNEEAEYHDVTIQNSMVRKRLFRLLFLVIQLCTRHIINGYRSILWQKTPTSFVLCENVLVTCLL